MIQKKKFYIRLKEEATKRLPLIIWGHSLGEYLYVFVPNGLTLRHKIYSITQEDDILGKIIGEGRKKMQALSIWLETKYCYIDE